MNTEKLISISPGNRKMGLVPSISLPPLKTCKPNPPCEKDCYALRMTHRLAIIKRAWERNLLILRSDPSSYWRQLEAFIGLNYPAYFRFHVGGDIPNITYLEYMEYLASDFPRTRFLVFSSQPFIHPSRIHNLVIMKSVWTDDLPSIDPRFPCYYVYKDKPFKPIGRIIECPGRCPVCNYSCWHSLTGDIVQTPLKFVKKHRNVVPVDYKEGDNYESLF